MLGGSRARLLVGLGLGLGLTLGVVAQPAGADRPIRRTPVSEVAAAAPAAVDRAGTAGLARTDKSWSASPVDYDNDGDQDVWIGYHQWSGRMWVNQGNGTYRQASTNAWPRTNPEGKVPDRHECGFADVDANGLVDSYCSAGRNQSNRVKYGMDNEMWLQRRAGVFEDVAQESKTAPWGVGELCGRGRHVAFFDYNHDGYPDLFVGNERPRQVSDPCDNPANGLPNEESKLYRNDAGLGFTYVQNGISGAGPGQRCAEVLDIDSDGWDDLITCRLSSQTPRLYRNNAGRGFTEASGPWNLTQPLADAMPVDLNRDGRTDLVTASKSGFDYRLNTGTRFAAPVRLLAVGTGEGRSVAVGDADGDGNLDIYAMVGGKSGNPNDSVLLGDGRLGYTRVPVPGAGGEADEVIALQASGITGRRTDFLVLNGSDEAGPIQLIRVN